MWFSDTTYQVAIGPGTEFRGLWQKKTLLIRQKSFEYVY